MLEEKKTGRTESRSMSRREFIGTTAAAAAAFTIVPRHVLGGPGYIPPSEKTNLAMIGVGGQGNVDLGNFMPMPEVQVVGVCDVYKECDYSKFYFGGVKGWEPTQKLVDRHYAQQKRSGQYKGCYAYVDFYEMLDKESDIDAISVATTDSLHALAAMAGIKRGKHVYCQKPLTHDVFEARALAEAAREAGVASQMGNQGHAGEGNRLMKEWIQDGAIGDVHEVHVWTNRPYGYWPQGVGRPEEKMRVPRGLDWDRWLGPAPYRPYHEIYVPFNWRGVWDFGSGALGDMGCHLLDTPHYVLDLPQPVRIEASATPVNDETAPVGSIIHYEFPAQGSKPSINLTWYDGGLKPKRPEVLEQGRRMGDGSGVIIMGDKGTILCNTYGENPRLIPESAMKAYQTPPKTLKRVPGIYQDFINACQGGDPACSNFDVSGPLTEITLLGNLALRAVRAEKPLEWDAEKLEVTNYSNVNKYVKRKYRKGWLLEK
ncbi:MAG: Gfo/Idh/MocA family oxidoreductase [Fidelibacterota bacterium]|nr:MAG: Gfo/Idh/MocA family oxidoreductase [Candidatus Neomarinimicrobiota bacterium]